MVGICRWWVLGLGVVVVGFCVRVGVVVLVLVGRIVVFGGWFGV